MEEKLQSIIERYDLITADLNDPLIINDTAKFRIASREYKTLEPIAEAAHKYIQLMKTKLTYFMPIYSAYLIKIKIRPI